MSDDDVPELRRLERDVRRVRLARRVIVAGAALWIPVMFAWIAGVGGEGWAGLFIPVMVAGAVMHMAALGAAMAIGARMARVDHPAAVGPLIDATIHLSAAGPATRRALIRLLPKLAGSGYALTDAQQRYLYRVLESGESVFGSPPDNEPLRVAILRALESAGDEAAVPLVRRLAYGSSSPHVALAAKECLPVVTQRLEREREGRRLLRASAQPDANATLLRPARGARDAADTLPRPVDEPAEADQAANVTIGGD